MKVEWRDYVYGVHDPKLEDLIDVPLWVFEAQYEGVTIGYWMNGWWETLGHGDDVDVTHWAPMEYPNPPEGAKLV